MGVFRESTLKWDGKEHTVTVDMNLLRAIERKGVNIMSVSHGLSSGQNLMLGHLCLMTSMVLDRAGVKAADDEIYAEFLNDPNEIVALMSDVIVAMSPAEKAEKKPDGQDEKPQK